MAENFHDSTLALATVSEKVSAVTETNNNGSKRRLTVREESILSNMLNNLTRDKTTVAKHITGAARELQSNLNTISYGIGLLMRDYDGQPAAVMKTRPFLKLAHRVFSFIQKQTVGRKLFVVSVSSPITGFDTVYFSYYLTAKTVKPEDLRLMVPFMDHMMADIEKLDDVTTETTLDITPKPEVVEKPAVKPFGNAIPKSLPPVPISPIVTAAMERPRLIRQSTVVEEPAEEPTEETTKKPQIVDGDGFWVDNESNFSQEADEWNKNQKKGNILVIDPKVNILNEIFQNKLVDVSTPAINIPTHDSETTPRGEISAVNMTPSRDDVSAANMTPAHVDISAVNDLPDEIANITPINTTPAVKEHHRNAKSRLHGRRGSRQNMRHQHQRRRDSFDALPSGSQHSLDVRLNATVPDGRELQKTLDFIVSRLADLEKSIANVSQNNVSRASKIISNKAKKNNRVNSNQTLPRYSPPLTSDGSSTRHNQN